MLCSESTGYCHSPSNVHVSCCTWDGIFLPINNFSMSCRCVNKRNSISSMQVWIWVCGWYFRVCMERRWALKGHWVIGRYTLDGCHNSNDPFLSLYKCGVLEWIRRDSKIHLNFDTNAYCHRKLDRQSIKYLFFHYNCVRIPKTQENPSKCITAQKSAFMCSLYPEGVRSCFCTVSSLVCVTTQKCFDVTNLAGK